MITDPLSMPLSRRVLLASALSCALPATARAALPQNIGDDPFPLKPFDYSLLPPDYRRKVIPYSGRHRPGTVIVDTAARQLYFILGNGKAIRFGCAVGRDGFRWAGVADVGRKVMWPRWTPPEEMIRRSPEKAKWKNGMPGGPENPLGARALYLFQNGSDTLFRIHGTNEPLSIGKNASSGCIRMINQDVKELFDRAPVGTRVLVMAEGV